MTMSAPNAVTAYQDAYVQKVIDTVGDLPNVLWEISEEAPTNSTWWQGHMIGLIRSYETGKPLQHPIGYPTLEYPGNDSALNNSNADWIAPTARISPTSSCGSGNPACKVNINDSDHDDSTRWSAASIQKNERRQQSGICIARGSRNRLISAAKRVSCERASVPVSIGEKPRI